MKALTAVLLLISALAAPAVAGDYTMNNRPEVIFKGGIVHQTPYPQGKRAASVWFWCDVRLPNADDVSAMSHPCP